MHDELRAILTAVVTDDLMPDLRAVVAEHDCGRFHSSENLAKSISIGATLPSATVPDRRQVVVFARCRVPCDDEGIPVDRLGYLPVLAAPARTTAAYGCASK